MHKTPNVSVNGKDVIIRTDRALFAKLLAGQEKRSVSIKELLQYSLEPIACPLQH